MNGCQQCRNDLVKYINEDLSPQLMREMAAHLQNCDTCYALYRYERDAAQQIAKEFAFLGMPEGKQLDRMWRQVSSDLENPETPIHHYDWLHGLAAVLLVTLTILPWVFHLNNFASVTLTSGITPAVVPGEETPEGTESSRFRRVALNLNVPTEDAELPPTPTSTPAIAPVPNS